MDAMLRGEGGRRISSVGIGWLGETQSGGSVSGVFPSGLHRGPQIVPRMRCGRGVRQIQ